MSKTSINIHAAFLRDMADAFGSIAVLVAGALILLYDWYIVDSLVTFLVAGYILWHAFAEIGYVIRILMLGSPSDLDVNTIITDILAVEGVSNLHHVHLWQIDEHTVALDSHVVVREGFGDQADIIKQSVKTVLYQNYDIAHTTLKLECSQHSCSDTTLNQAACYST